MRFRNRPLSFIDSFLESVISQGVRSCINQLGYYLSDNYKICFNQLGYHFNNNYKTYLDLDCLPNYLYPFLLNISFYYFWVILVKYSIQII